MKQTSSDAFTAYFNTLTPIDFLFAAILFVFIVLMITYIIRVWLVQTATFKIQQDLQDIKNHLMPTREEPVKIPVQEQVVAIQADKTSELDVPKVAKNPSKTFLWLLAAIVLIFIIVMVINFSIAR